MNRTGRRLVVTTVCAVQFDQTTEAGNEELPAWIDTLTYGALCGEVAWRARTDQ